MTDPSGYTPRVAIVTGAASGIGYSIAIRLADDGIDVVVNDLPSSTERLHGLVEEIKKKGRRSIAVSGDVSKEDDVKQLIEKAVAELGSVDVMVANAGIFIGENLLDATVEQMDKTYAVNLRGVFLCYKYAALRMVKQGKGGRLIAASSAGGRRGAQTMATYSATKFAVRGLNQTAAIELHRHGITANVYAPGVIRTAIFDNYVQGEGDTAELASMKLGADPKIFPIGTPDMVASTVSYLVKPENHHVTGQTLSVDGGLCMT